MAYPLRVVTMALVLLGYRPFLLRKSGTGELEEVWSKSEEQVRFYDAGKVVPILLQQDTRISRHAVIVLEEDGRIWVNTSNLHPV